MMMMCICTHGAKLSNDFLKTFSSARVVGKNHMRPAFLFHERFDRETVK